MNRRTHLPNFLKHSYPVEVCASAYLKFRTRQVEKYIFVATTGRSGTLALTKLFAEVPGCRAEHEPHPVMNEGVLYDASFGGSSRQSRRYHRLKMINIRRAAVGHRYYVETNHLFVKTFIEQAVEHFGERLEVIHLVRAPLDVAMSIFRLRDEPGTENGNRWWLDHRAPLNRIPIADALEHDREFSHPFYKGLWYWYEVEARVREWRRRLPQVRFHHFETEWLNDQQRVFHLLEELGIAFDAERIAERVGSKEHARDEHKCRPQLSCETAERMQERFEELLAQRGLLQEAMQKVMPRA